MEHIRHLLKSYNRNVLLLQLIIAILVATLVALKSVAGGQLLSQYGADVLPQAYMVIALLSIGIYRLIHIFLDRYSIRRVLFFNHLLQILAIISLVVISLQGQQNDAFGLYIYASLYALITVTFFYQYMQNLFSIREAKKVYPHVGAAAILGGIAGGYTTSLILHHLSLAWFFGLIGIALTVTLGLYAILFRHTDSFEIDQEELDNSYKVNIRGILQNDHVTRLALIMGLGVILSKLVDYQFNDIVENHFHDSVDIATFFGFWFSTINVIGVLIQVFLTKPLLDRWGMVQSVALFPSLLLLGFLALMAFPGLAFAILLKAIDGSLKQSIHKTATDIFYMPLSRNLRHKAKSMIDIVVDSLATGLAGALIFVVVRLFSQGGFIVINLLAVVLAAICIYIILAGQESYKKTLVNMLAEEEENPSSNSRFDQLAKEIDLKNVEKIKRSFAKVKDQSALSELIRRKIMNRQKINQPVIDQLTQADNLVLARTTFRHLLEPLSPRQILRRIKKENTRNKIIILGVVDLWSLTGKALRRQELKMIAEKLLKHILDENDHSGISNELQEDLFVIISKFKFHPFYSYVETALTEPFDQTHQENALNALCRAPNDDLYALLFEVEILQGNHQMWLKSLAKRPRRLRHHIQNASPRVKVELMPALAFAESQRGVHFLINLLDHNHSKVRIKALECLHRTRKNFPHLTYQDKRHRKRLKEEHVNLKYLMSCKVFIEQKNYLKRKDRFRRKIDVLINQSIIRCFILMSLIAKLEFIELIYARYKKGAEEKVFDLLDELLPFAIKKHVMPTIELAAKHSYNHDMLKLLNVPMPSSDNVADVLHVTGQWLKEEEPSLTEDRVN